MVGARLLEEMLASEPPGVGKRRGHPGGRTPLRHHHPRDLPAPEPHLRHAARPRRHPRPGPVARRRDGRHRRVRGRHPALPDRSRALGARELARIIARATTRCARALRRSSRRSGVHVLAVEINRLENEADASHHEALRRLFEEERDPIAVIKWKEVLDLLEDATDRCEDVANVLRGRRGQARLSAGWTPTCSPSPA